MILFKTLQRYWRAAILLVVLLLVAVVLPFLEVRNPTLTMLVSIIVAVYFFATWACKPKHGKDNEKK